MLHQFKQDMIEVDHNNPAEESILNKLKEN
jgi:hypothetical protein